MWVIAKNSCLQIQCEGIRIISSGIVKPGDFGCSENSTAFPEMEMGQNEIEAQGEPLLNSPAKGNDFLRLYLQFQDKRIRMTLNGIVKPGDSGHSWSVLAVPEMERETEIRLKSEPRVSRSRFSPARGIFF